MPRNVSDIAHDVHEQVHSVNPFLEQETYTRGQLMAYKITTALSWLLVVITSIYYTFEHPHEGKYARHTIWGQNRHMHTPFAMNPVITSIYWIVLYILQIGYIWHLYSSTTALATSAANIGPHFIFHNLLLFGFIHLWVRSHFWLAELLLVVNFFNLSSAYFRHSATPRFIHVPAVAGPLAWNFIALYWCGAAMVHAHSLPARIFANIAIWGVLVYGGFFLVAFKDWSMGFALSVLTFATGVTQFLTKVIAFQWIFAFVIATILFLLSIGVAFPQVLGREPFKRGQIVSEDRERAPLLADESRAE